MTHRGTAAPPMQLVCIVQDLLAAHGPKKTAKLVGCGCEGVLRIAAGQPVRLGTIALAEKNVGNLDLQVA